MTDERPVNSEVVIREKQTHPSPPTPARVPLNAAKFAPPLPRSAHLPGVPVTDIRLPWMPSRPHPRPLYRDFGGRAVASSRKADDHEDLSLIYRAILAFIRPGPRTKLDLTRHQSEYSSGKQLRHLINTNTSRVRFGIGLGQSAPGISSTYPPRVRNRGSVSESRSMDRPGEFLGFFNLQIQ